ncbi:MAG: hypothetical protein O7C75_03220 [Verrucomicrobia bacterium]|nr:hypothetical protein [Verrucomicrobiota bacterium]
MMQRRQFLGLGLAGVAGLGLDLDEQVAAKIPYTPKDWSAHEWSDGAICDR